MKPGPRRPKTKFLPHEVIDEMVTASSQYFHNILQAVDALGTQETDSEKIKKLNDIRENTIKQRANFRILSKQISDDIDYIFGQDDVVAVEHHNIFSTMPNKLTPHFSGDLKGWSLHLERPEMFHLAHVNYKPSCREFVVDCVVTFIQRPSQPDVVFINAIYLDEDNERQFPKAHKLTLSNKDFSLTLLPLLKHLETKRFVFDNSEKPPQVFSDNDVYIKEEPKEQVSSTHTNFKRKRASRFSKEFLREAMGDSDIEDEEMAKALKRKREASERKDKTFILADNHGSKDDNDFNDSHDHIYVGVCRLCGMDLTFKLSIDHIRLNHKDQIDEYYKCPVCGESSTSMVYHIKRVHVSSFSCDICQKLFATQTGVEKHRTMAHFRDQLQFQCELCANRFETQKDVNFHVKTTHNKDKRHVCHVCGTRFYAPSKLKIHLINVHQLFEKEYGCHLCEKKFAGQKSLAYHFKSHSERREYKCDVCPKMFKTNTNLKQHKISHKPPKHECKFCGKMFLYPQGMRFHVKHVHHESVESGPPLVNPHIHDR